MTDPTEGDDSIAARSLDIAADAVHAATDQVARVGQHLRDKVDAAKRPETYLGVLKDMTRAAPLGMLAAAFIGGMIIGRRR